MLPDEVADWRDLGRVVPTAAGGLFVRTTAGDGLPILFLHGYPSSSFDWRFVIAELAGRATVAFDFLGFGLSAKPRPHRYSLFEQADLVAEVLAVSGVDRVDVVAHDMGTSVATELIAREIEGRLPFGMENVVLGNGSVIIERASLRPIQNVLRSPIGPLVSRLSSGRMFRREFGALFSTGHRLTRNEADAQWALVSYDNGQRIMHQLISYIDERIEFAPRWHGAIRNRRRPVDFLWATGDIVATPNVLAGLQELRPSARTIELDDLGHYPQLEDPVAYTASMLGLLTPDPP